MYIIIYIPNIIYFLIYVYNNATMQNDKNENCEILWNTKLWGILKRIYVIFEIILRKWVTDCIAFS